MKPNLLFPIILVAAIICCLTGGVRTTAAAADGKNGRINGGIIQFRHHHQQEDYCTPGGICRSFDAAKVAECHQREAVRKEANAKFMGKFQKREEEKHLDIGQMKGVDTKVFAGFLENSENNAEQLLKVFKYLTQMKQQPICLAKITLDSLAKLSGQTATTEAEEVAFLTAKISESARQSRELLQKQVAKGQAGKDGQKIGGDAFLFGPDGVVEIFIADDGHKCAESLLHPERVVLLLQTIIKALEAEQKMNSAQKETWVDTMNFVVNYLDQHPVQQTTQTDAKGVVGPMKNPWIVEMKEEWKNTMATLKKKGVKKDMEDFAVWLLRPSHIDGMVQIILFITGLESTVDLGLMTLKLFGIDELFTKAMEKIGIKIEVATGIDRRVVRWAFGPNGVMPLFVRYGEFQSATQVEEFDELLDEAGQRHKVIKMGVEAEKEFLKKIITELIEHKGRPMHELMDNLVENFKKMDTATRQKWDAHIGQWEKQWALVKSQMNEKAIRADFKKFAVWFMTPDRVNDLIQLILAATDLATPVYLGLSALDLFGITDLFLKEMNLVDEKLKIADFLKNHPHGEKAIEFMIGKDGVVPLFIGASDLSSEEKRESRNEHAADLITIVADVLVKHKSPGVRMGRLYEFLLETVQSQEFYLEVIQRWNDWLKNHHKKLQTRGIVPISSQGSSNHMATNMVDAEEDNSTSSAEIHRKMAKSTFCACIPRIFPGGRRPTGAQIKARRKKAAASSQQKKHHSAKYDGKAAQLVATSNASENVPPKCIDSTVETTAASSPMKNVVVVHSATGYANANQHQQENMVIVNKH